MCFLNILVIIFKSAGALSYSWPAPEKANIRYSCICKANYLVINLQRSSSEYILLNWGKNYPIQYIKATVVMVHIMLKKVFLYHTWTKISRK